MADGSRSLDSFQRPPAPRQRLQRTRPTGSGRRSTDAVTGGDGGSCRDCRKRGCEKDRKECRPPQPAQQPTCACREARPGLPHWCVPPCHAHSHRQCTPAASRPKEARQALAADGPDQCTRKCCQPLAAQRRRIRWRTHPTQLQLTCRCPWQCDSQLGCCSG